jgi:DNA-binding transcriptional ArsR family regulator
MAYAEPSCARGYVRLALPFVEAYRDAGLGLLGDPTRRAIFELLARRPSSVGELAQQLPVSRPAVSQHLRVLKDGGLVISQADGTRRVYRLNPDGVAALRLWLDRVWDDALTAFQKVAEAPSDNLTKEDS